MKTLLRIQMRAFRRNRSLLIVTLLFVLAVAAQGGYELFVALRTQGGALEALSFSTRYSLLWPLAAVVLTYEFVNASIRAHMAEATEAVPDASHRHWLAASAVPGLVLAFTFCVYALLRVSVVLVSPGQSLLVPHVLLAAVLDIFAPTFIGFLLGLVIAQRKRFGAYAAIVLFVFLVGPYSEIVPFSFQFATLNTGRIVDIYPAYDLVRILAPDPTWFVDSLYGFPVEQQRWALAAMWAFLLFALAAPLVIIKRRSRTAAAAALSLSALCLAIVLLPSAEMRRDFRPSGTGYNDQVFYEVQASKHPARNTPAPFSVKHYEITLAIGCELSADVDMTLSGGPRDGGYRFTLYHGYRLRRVENAAGEAMEFVREGDYVTVPADRREDRLRFVYAGTGGRQIANNQAVFLPGYFPYYPVPGEGPVWDSETHSVVTSGLKRDPALFSIRAIGGPRLASNLPTRGGAFEGTTASPTLMGGLVAERRIAGHRVLYLPASGVSLDELAAALKRVEELERRLETRDLIPAEAPIFQLPDLAQPGTAAITTSDTAFVSMFHPAVAVDVLLADAPMRPDRTNLRSAFMYYLNDRNQFLSEASRLTAPDAKQVAALEVAREGAKDGAAMMGGYQRPSQSVVFRLFYDRIRSDGEDRTLKAAYDYLVSADPASELAFLTRDHKDGR